METELLNKEMEHKKIGASSSHSLRKQLEQTWLSLLPSMENLQRELDLFATTKDTDLNVYRDRFREASIKKYNFDKLLKACPKVTVI